MVYLEKSWMIKFFWECFLTSFIFHHKEEWEWRSLYLVLLRCLILFWAHSTTLKKATKNKKIPHEFHYFCTGEQWRYSHGHEMWNTNSSNFTPFAVSQFFAMTVICMSSYDKALLKVLFWHFEYFVFFLLSNGYISKTIEKSLWIMIWITLYTFSLSKKNFNFKVLLQGGIIVYCIQMLRTPTLLCLLPP